METSGIVQAAETDQAAAIAKHVKDLLKLQGELIVELIEGARVPGPADTMTIPGMGSRIDIHV